MRLAVSILLVTLTATVSLCGRPAQAGPAADAPVDDATRLLKWEILARHGDAGMLAAEVTAGYVESRQAGIARLRLTFSGPVDPATLGVGALGIRGRLGGDLSDMVAGMWLEKDDTVLVVQLAEALDDGDRYTLSLSDQVRAAAGARIAGGHSCEAAALVGDTDGSGRVDYADVQALRAAAAAAKIDASVSRFDVDCNGRLDESDEQTILSRTGRTLPKLPKTPA
ncbi:MAG: EF-hand domain-containing protein [Planctomycetes bacterium]|nr:EF-hand domain-containing protein [Planctomycetota bacterium]